MSSRPMDAISTSRLRALLIATFSRWREAQNPMPAYLPTLKMTSSHSWPCEARQRRAAFGVDGCVLYWGASLCPSNLQHCSHGRSMPKMIKGCARARANVLHISFCSCDGECAVNHGRTRSDECAVNQYYVTHMASLSCATCNSLSLHVAAPSVVSPWPPPVAFKARGWRPLRRHRRSAVAWASPATS